VEDFLPGKTDILVPCCPLARLTGLTAIDSPLATSTEKRCTNVYAPITLPGFQWGDFVHQLSRVSIPVVKERRAFFQASVVNTQFLKFLKLGGAMQAQIIALTWGTCTTKRKIVRVNIADAIRKKSCCNILPASKTLNCSFRVPHENARWHIK